MLPALILLLLPGAPLPPLRPEPIPAPANIAPGDDSTDPPFGDAQRFPPCWYAREQRQIAGNHCAWVNLMVGIDRRNYSAWRDEANHLYRVWDNLWWAQERAEQGNQKDARFWLARVRELIGQDAYDAGRLPPSLPLWRFQRE